MSSDGMPRRARVHLASKRCAGRCGRILPLDRFYREASKVDGRQSYCPDCKAADNLERRWLHLYGVTPVMAQNCLERQGNRCPICGDSLTFESLSGLHRPWRVVCDHDNHLTGEVRGLLHDRCNTRSMDGPERAAAWAAYVSDPPMRAVNGGVPLIAPCSGLGEQQISIFAAYEEEAVA